MSDRSVTGRDSERQRQRQRDRERRVGPHGGTRRRTAARPSDLRERSAATPRSYTSFGAMDACCESACARVLAKPWTALPRLGCALALFPQAAGFCAAAACVALGLELSPRALLRTWYVKGVFETDDSLDPGRDVTGYAVLVSSFGLGGEQRAQCLHDGCAVQLTDLARVWWQQFSITELVEAMKISPDHAAAMCVAAPRIFLQFLR